MRQAARRSLLTVMATGGVLASTAGYAYADAGAIGSADNSPGVGSGNTIQAPIDVPVNICGNTVNVVGLLNPASGNHCDNASGGGAKPGSAATGHSHGSPGVGSGNTVQIPIDVPVNACGDSATVVGGLNSAAGNGCATHGHGTTGTGTGTGWTPPGSGTGTPPGGWTPPGGGGGTPPHHCGCTPPPSPPPVSPPPPVKHHSPPPPPPAKHQSPPPPPATTKVAPQSEVLASTGAAGVGVLAPSAAALMLGGGVLYRRSRKQGQR